MSKGLLLALLGLALGLGCFGPESQRTDRLNPHLRRVLDLAPLEHPIWVTPSRLYGYHNGIVEVVIDSMTLDYRYHAEFGFSYHIWTMSYDRAAREILIIYVESYQDDGLVLSSYRAARVSLTNQQVVINDEIIGAAAVPWGIASWPGKPGIVYYGMNPSNNVRGFYWKRGAEVDSLILAVELDPRSARGMAIDPTGCHLFFFQGSHPATLHALDLTQTNAQPTAIIQRAGGRGMVVPHPSNPDLLLLNYFFRGDGINPPRGHVELLNLSTLESHDLDVRTHTALELFVLNDHPWWSPDGRHLAFGAAASSGEGDQFWAELWIYQDVER